VLVDVGGDPPVRAFPLVDAFRSQTTVLSQAEITTRRRG